MRENLTRKERLTGGRTGIPLVFKAPNYTASCQGARLLARNNSLSYSRMAVAPVRKFGSAVKRNYTRRIVREIYRKTKGQLAKGLDIVFVLYPGDYGYHEREKQVIFLAQKAGILLAG